MNYIILTYIYFNFQLVHHEIIQFHMLALDELMKLMRNCACDIFPDDDSFCYLNDGNCEKNYVLEMNIYNVNINMTFLDSHV